MTVDEILMLPCAGYRDKEAFPSSAAVYFVVSHNKPVSLLYIGCTRNLSRRWNGTHHIYQLIKNLPGVCVHWFINEQEFKGLLKLESAWIKELRPKFAGVKYGKDSSRIVSLRLNDETAKQIDAMGQRENRNFTNAATRLLVLSLRCLDPEGTGKEPFDSCRGVMKWEPYKYLDPEIGEPEA
jgi:hypothetical protein